MPEDIDGDAPRRQDHEQPRVPHEAQQAPGSTEGSRRTRHRQLAIAAAIVVAVLAAVLIAAGGSSSSPPKPGSAQADATVRGIGALLAGIPQSANTLGQPTAPVTLEWYGDLECPFCKAFTLGALPSIIRQWVRGGKLKIEYLSMETATREPKVFQTQQVAALAAGLQNKMWNFIETFYHEQGEEDSGYVTEQYLHGLASQVPGLNVALWNEDRYDPVLATQVEAERQAAKRAHFIGTPSFLIGLTGGKRYGIKPRSLTSPLLFNKTITLLLATQSSNGVELRS
jgi:protein-disulfide isomerase